MKDIGNKFTIPESVKKKAHDNMLEYVGKHYRKNVSAVSAEKGFIDGYERCYLDQREKIQGMIEALEFYAAFDDEETMWDRRGVETARDALNRFREEE